ncbi:hypothetical protein GPALN_013080 [Globodera pallida]|nr:hypothetical protein GPALN_013080 [Globodera pallida]
MQQRLLHLFVRSAKQLHIRLQTSSTPERGNAVFGTLAGHSSAHGIALCMLDGSFAYARQAVHCNNETCDATVDGAHVIGGKVLKCHCGWVWAICGMGATKVGGGQGQRHRVRNSTRYVNVTIGASLVMHAKKLGVVKGKDDDLAKNSCLVDSANLTLRGSR